MEIEFFVPPADAAEWHEPLDGGADALVHRPRASGPTTCSCASTAPDELSHYSSATSDIEYLFPMGWSELEGIANRGDFDLTQHAKFSGEKLDYVDPGTGERYVPHVIEPSAGADRGTLAFMVDAYDEEEVEGRERVVLRLHPRLAPVKVAVLPLVNKEGQPELAREIYEDLRTRMSAEFDTGGSIGKRYRRQDEIGTPWGVTVDHQTMEDGTVTLRDRDSLDQSRIAIDELGDELQRRLAAPWRSPKLELGDACSPSSSTGSSSPGTRPGRSSSRARVRRSCSSTGTRTAPTPGGCCSTGWRGPTAAQSRSTCRASAPATGSTVRADPAPARPLRRGGGRAVRTGRRRGGAAATHSAACAALRLAERAELNLARRRAGGARRGSTWRAGSR